MGDEKLKQELFYIVKLSTKYDFTDMSVVEGILRLENERKILNSVFGSRFKSRIFDIAAGVCSDDSCVICGQAAENRVVCKKCMDSILDSEYAKSQLKETPKKFQFNIKIPEFIKNFKVNWKKILQYSAIVCLTLLMMIQIYVLSVWLSLPTYNKTQSPRQSQYSPVAVSSEEQAYDELIKDYPESEGYKITFARQGKEFVGKFLIDVGQCCEEVEETLTDEERYDYFFQEDVYVFYISNVSDYSAMIGKAEINESGAIIVIGSFNDGRKTDCFYRFR